MKDNDELAAAKARLIALAAAFDPLQPVRAHPLASVAIAGASGVIVGGNPEWISQAAKLATVVAGLVEKLEQKIEEHRPAPPTPETAS
jgi:hypothetical protein